MAKQSISFAKYPVTVELESWQDVNLGTAHRTSDKTIANGPVGQVLAGPLFLKVKTKFHFTKS